MTTYLGKSCSFCLPRVPFVNCRQFMYLVISLLVLRAGYGIWLYQFLIIAYLFTFDSPVKKSYTTLQRLWVGILRYRNTARLLKMYMKFLGNTTNPQLGVVGGGVFIWNVCTNVWYFWKKIEGWDAGYTFQVHHYSRDRFVLAAHSLRQQLSVLVFSTISRILARSMTMNVNDERWLLYPWYMKSIGGI